MTWHEERLPIDRVNKVRAFRCCWQAGNVPPVLVPKQFVYVTRARRFISLPLLIFSEAPPLAKPSVGNLI